jgi:iron(III) transport system permease protein
LGISKIEVAGRGIVRWLLLVGLLTPLSLQAAAWQAAAGPGGWLSGLASATTSSSTAYAWGWWGLSGWWGAIWVHGLGAMPWVALFTWATVRTVPAPWEEESLIDASSWKVLWVITVRVALRGIAAAGIWVAVICATEIAVTDFFLTAPGQHTFAEEIYVAASLGVLGDAVAGIAGHDLLLGTLILAVVAAAALVLLADQLPQALGEESHRRWQWRPRRGQWLATSLVWWVALTATVVPLASLAWKAGLTSQRIGDQTVREWDVAKVIELTASSPWEQRREWFWTLLISSTAALLAITLAVHLVWCTRNRLVARMAVVVLMASALAVPGPLLSVIVIRLVNQPASSFAGVLTWLYDRTLFAPIVVQTVRVLPVVWLACWSLLASFPQQLIEHARSDGLGTVGQLWRVVLPARWLEMAVVTAMAFALMSGELSATLLVTPPGVTTLSVRLFGLLHYGVDDRAAAICLSAVAGAGLLAAAAAVAAWRYRRLALE